MASTSEGAALTEQHRRRQLQIRNATAARLLELWPLLDERNVDGTRDAWIGSALPVVAAGARTSREVAVSYLNEFRGVELGAGLPADLQALLRAAPAVDVAQVVTSLEVTGPVAIKQAAARGQSIGQAVELARAASAAAGSRHALGASRSTMMRAVSNDAAAQFWSRVTDGQPCGFCALLASRGAVFQADTVAFRAHDRCGCTAEIGYQAGALSSSAERYRQQYDEVTRELAAGDERVTPEAVRREFRRRVEGSG